MQQAVALRYPKHADAPFISAITKGAQADYLLRLAETYHVPVVKDAALANVLSIQRVGDMIPEDTYEVLSKIFAFVITMEKAKNDEL